MESTQVHALAALEEWSSVLLRTRVNADDEIERIIAYAQDHATSDKAHHEQSTFDRQVDAAGVLCVALADATDERQQLMASLEEILRKLPDSWQELSGDAAATKQLCSKLMQGLASLLTSSAKPAWLKQRVSLAMRVRILEALTVPKGASPSSLEEGQRELQEGSGCSLFLHALSELPAPSRSVPMHTTDICLVLRWIVLHYFQGAAPTGEAPREAASAGEERDARATSDAVRDLRRRFSSFAAASFQDARESFLEEEAGQPDAQELNADVASGAYTGDAVALPDQLLFRTVTVLVAALLGGGQGTVGRAWIRAARGGGGVMGQGGVELSPFGELMPQAAGPVAKHLTVAALQLLVQAACASVEQALKPLLRSSQPATGGKAPPSPARAAVHPSAALLGASAHLAIQALHLLWHRQGHAAGSPSEQGGMLMEEVEATLDVLLDSVERCTAGALHLPPSDPEGQELLDMATFVAVLATMLLSAGAQLGVSMTDPAARLRAVLQSAATLVPQGVAAVDAASGGSAEWLAGAGWSAEGGSKGPSVGIRKLLKARGSKTAAAVAPAAGVWHWDLTVPFAEDDARYRIAGLSAWRLCRAAAEGLCAALAAGWGGKARSVMLPMTSLSIASADGSGDQAVRSAQLQARVLCVGRLYHMLQGEDELTQLSIPMLLEQISDSSDASLSCHTPPEVLACVVDTLASMAAVSAQSGTASSKWACHHLIQLLVKLYKSRETGVGLLLMYSGHKASAAAGSLAGALHTLALGLQDADRDTRGSFRRCILELFSDFAQLGHSHDHLMDLGALLPAIAAACSDLSARMGLLQRHLTGSSSAILLAAFTGHTGDLRSDQGLLRLYRNLWMYSALYGFSSHSNGASGTKWPAAWGAALGEIAAITPVLTLGGSEFRDAEVFERLKAELEPRLDKCGSRGSGAEISLRLQTLLAGIANPGGASSSADRVRHVYLLTVAVLEAERASSSPLPAPHEPPPFAAVLTVLQSCTSGSTAFLYFRAVAVRVFRVYVDRLLHATQSTIPPASVSASDSNSSLVVPAYEGLAELLIQALSSSPPQAAKSAASAAHRHPFHLRNLSLSLAGGLHGGAGEQGEASVGLIADTLLDELLDCFPDLYYSQRCLNALMESLIVEESLSPMQSSESTPTWRRLVRWLSSAAHRAPSFLEAMLHEFLWHAHSQGRPEGALAQLAAARGDGEAPPAPSGFQAASRTRVAELTTIIAKARASNHLASLDAQHSGPSAYQAKSFSRGLAAGLLRAEEARGVSLEEVQAQATVRLRAAVASVMRHQKSLASLVELYLEAAALLVLKAHVMVPLLRVLCSTPVHIFTPDLLAVATFAWEWLIVAVPASKPALFCQLLRSWNATIQSHLGLFSGRRRPAEAAPDETPLPQQLQAHHLWISFLLQSWDASRHDPSASGQALRKMFMHLCHSSLEDLEALSLHAAAAGAYFRLLQLALTVVRHARKHLPHAGQPACGLLYQRVLAAGLRWFQQPPSAFGRWSRREAEEEAFALQDFLQLLSSLAGIHDDLVAGSSSGNGTRAGTAAPHPVWGTLAAPQRAEELAKRLALLQLLCKDEARRLRLWAAPLAGANHWAEKPLAAAAWRQHLETAWAVEPRIAVHLRSRFRHEPQLQEELERLALRRAAARGEARLLRVPEVALILCESLLLPQRPAGERRAVQARLAAWAPLGVAQALQVLAGAQGGEEAVKAYALRSLQVADPEQVAFYLPQLVQALRNDADGQLANWMVGKAASSWVFGHRLMWALTTEERPPAAAFNPETKRSGWEPPQDTGLWDSCAALKARVRKRLSPLQLEYMDAEVAFFDAVTAVSGKLKPFAKDERRARAKAFLADIPLSRQDLYLPTNPHMRLLKLIPESGTPMQSAAKTPILVAFRVALSPSPLPPAAATPHVHILSEEATPQVEPLLPAPMTSAEAPLQPPSTSAAADPPEEQVQACIFKVGDDCRQDVVALQVIEVLRQAYGAAGLDLYVVPYAVLPTGYEMGIIEVVKNTQSRAALGEVSDAGLMEIFQREFGNPGTPKFEQARRNFMVSEAGYAIASLLLQAKDRHNGNLLIDDEGHLVHIDFGFILEISPGGNLRFESADFKLSHEMTQLIDPGGTRTSQTYLEFEELCVRGYLAARRVEGEIVTAVKLMQESGLPCFGRGRPLANLKERFKPDMNDSQAAAWMRSRVADAYDKWTTAGYDYIQRLQNQIPD